MYPYPTICTFSSTDQFSCRLMQLFPKLLEGPTLIGGPQTGGAVVKNPSNHESKLARSGLSHVSQ
jgi:hypothetical protein